MAKNSIEKAIETFGLKVNKIVSVPESHSSDVRILEIESGELVVIKIPWSTQKLEREKDALNKLQHLSYIPKVLDWYIQNNNSALLIEYIDGIPISNPQLLNKNLAFQMGVTLAQIHQTKMKDYEGIKSWQEHLSSKISTNLKICKSYQNHIELELLEDNYMTLIKQISERSPSLIHYDFRLGNLLTKNNELKGVIDFESARGGAADMDFFKLWKEVWLLNPEFKHQTIKGYKSITTMNTNLDFVLPIYALYHAVAGMSWCIQRNKHSDPFYEYNKKMLSEALTHLI